LPEKIATAAVEFLYGSLAANPHRVGKPLKLGLEGLHSARRGDYRVIYRIDDQHRRVDVVAIEATLKAASVSSVASRAAMASSRHRFAASAHSRAPQNRPRVLEARLT
jgi:mRNA interferase RelE/StbE